MTKLSAAQLKKRLIDLGISLSGLIEKADLVKALREALQEATRSNTPDTPNSGPTIHPYAQAYETLSHTPGNIHRLPHEDAFVYYRGEIVYWICELCNYNNTMTDHIAHLYSVLP